MIQQDLDGTGDQSMSKSRPSRAGGGSHRARGPVEVERFGGWGRQVLELMRHVSASNSLMEQPEE